MNDKNDGRGRSGTGIEQFESTGDWGPNPWFLENGSLEHGWLLTGLPLEKRVLGNEALQKIFPPDVVLQMRADPGKLAAFIVVLFGGMKNISAVAPLLDLGLNSQLVKPWDDYQMLRRLHHRAHHYDAVFEIAVHAALLRAGAWVAVLPERPPLRQPDFKIKFRGVEYEVEAKVVHNSWFDVIAEELDRRLTLSDLIVPDFEVTLRGSVQLAELSTKDEHQARAAIPSILRAFADAAKALSDAKVPGEYPAEEWGTLSATSHPGQAILHDLVFPDVSHEKQARRVIRKLKEGFGQFTGDSKGVVVVSMERNAQPDDVQRLLMNDVRAGLDVKRCAVVVLVDVVARWGEAAVAPQRIPLYYAFSPIGRELTKGQRMLAEAVASTHWSSALRVDWERDGFISTRVQSSRPKHSLHRLGGIELKAGETASFSISEE